MYINNQKFIPKRFSSGEMKLLSSTLDKYIINSKVEILYLNQESLFELQIIINYFQSKHVKVHLILSYLPYQRMDHKGRDELNTLKFVAQIFNSLNLENIIICEPHSEIDEFFNAKSISFVEKLFQKVKNDINFGKDDYLCFTDKGSKKRYSKLYGSSIYFEKERDLNTGLICKYNICGEFEPSKKFLIVDDIISTGDTICSAVELLKSYGVKNIYILSGHIENNKYNKRLLEYDCVKNIYSTNSLKKIGGKKLKLFDVREIVYGEKN